MEILSPAGNFTSAKKALDNGADAIYIGLRDIIHQRSRCSNFNDSQLKKIILIAKQQNKSIYITFNSSYNSQNAKEILNKIPYLIEIGIDAVILSDIGLIITIKKQYPELPIFFSVQGQCANTEFALLLKNIGVKRIIFDRNMSIKEAKTIKKNTGLEVEMFVFGYMCYSQDSICYMGDYFFDEPCNVCCAQKIKFDDDKTLTEKKRYFFMQYMCGLTYLPEMIDAGIDSIKIEGRQRSSKYVADVTKIFKEAIDLYKKDKANWKIKTEWIKTLKKCAYNFELSDYFFTQKEYKRKIIKDASFYGKLLFLKDCIISFTDSFNTTKFTKEIVSAFKTDKSRNN